MFYHDKRLQYPVRCPNPNPVFAKMLQQAIGGVEGEIRVCMQYFFQAMGARGPVKYRDMLMATATEELAHIEMLGHAIALNLRDAPASLQEEGAKDSIVGAVMGGQSAKDAILGLMPRHVLSSGLSAMPVDSNGTPFDMSHVYASGNIVADMMANAMAEMSGRTLAVRLYNMAECEGMKDMLSFMIARDTMHQEQWLAAIEDMGGLAAATPVPNSFEDLPEQKKFAYMFMGTDRNGAPPPEGRWTSGPSIDGKDGFHAAQAEPMGEVPSLGGARTDSGAQKEQMQEAPKAAK